MDYRLVSDDEARRYAVVFARGDLVMEGLKAFAEAEGMGAAELNAIGALASARLAYFDIETREYVEIPVDEQVEVASMNGRITLPLGGDPAPLRTRERHLHVHAVLSRRDGSTVAGHLVEATVRPTLEVFVSETRVQLTRREDPGSGLAVIALDQAVQPSVRFRPPPDA